MPPPHWPCVSHFLAALGVLWIRLDSYRFIWIRMVPPHWPLCVALSGGHFDSYGFLWIPIGAPNWRCASHFPVAAWIPLDSYGFLWTPLDSYELLCIPLTGPVCRTFRRPYGLLRTPMSSYGSPHWPCVPQFSVAAWIPMDSCEFPWVPREAQVSSDPKKR